MAMYFGYTMGEEKSRRTMPHIKICPVRSLFGFHDKNSSQIYCTIFCGCLAVPLYKIPLNHKTFSTNMEQRIVIACYRPKPDKAEALHGLMKEHLVILRGQDLVTDRPSIMMEAKDGTIIEVFEWKSNAAIERAHTNPEVLEMWGKFAAVCDYIPVAQVEEATQLFSAFTPFV
jgi:hypothetical protein